MCGGPLDELPSGVILAGEATAIGVGSRALTSAVRDGRLVRLRSGAYLRTDQWDRETPAGRYRWVVRAAARQLRDPVFSHESAAVLWHLPVAGRQRTVHVLGPQAPDGAARGMGRRGDVHWHSAARVPPVEVRDGARVTDIATTVAALGAVRGLLTTLAAADHALHEGLVTRPDLADAVGRLGRGHGVRRARTLVELADATSGSPGESASRARMHLEGFVAPQLQKPFSDDAGRFAIVDFWWPEVGVVGEFDGRVKYRIDGVDDRRRIEDRLWAEKLREDRLRALGVRVVRWTWSDIWRPGALAHLLTTAGVPRRG